MFNYAESEQKKDSSYKTAQSRNTYARDWTGAKGLSEESRSGLDSGDAPFYCHYNTSKPDELSASAFADGNQARIGTGHVIQRKPADFKGRDLIPDDIRSVAKIRAFSNWGRVERAVENYAELPEENLVTRSSKLTDLTEKIQSFNSSADETPESRQKRQGRTQCANQLSAKVTAENLEISNATGTLAGGATGVLPDPDFSGVIKPPGAVSAEKGVMFVNDTNILDEHAGILDANGGKRGKVARLVTVWTNTAEIKKATHTKVAKEDRAIAGEDFVDIHEGFAKNEDVLQVNRIARRSGYTHKEQKRGAQEQALFPHPPVMADVAQGHLGDCYLLAAMVSVVQKNPGHFVSHMKDNDNGTVTVKLYSSVDTPKTVTVNKSVAIRDDFFAKEPVYASGPLWVSIYEKAYVAAGFQGSAGELVGGKQSYGRIIGGDPAIALLHITGKQSESEQVDAFIQKGGTIGNLHVKAQELAGSLGNEYVQAAIRGAFHQFNFEIEDIVNKVFVTSADVEDLGNSKIQEIKARAEATLAICRTQYAPADPTQQNPVPNEIPADAVSGVMRDLIDHIKRNKLITGPLGSGKYTAKELQLFEAIKEKVVQGKAVTLSTRHDIYNDRKEIDGSGHSGDESMVKGLAGPHAYAVLDCRPKDPVDEGAETYAVKLRNPWGKTGRRYKKPDGSLVNNESGEMFVGAERVEDKAPEFWVDLAEIAAYFTKISYSSV